MKRILLVNPWIHDFSTYDLWIQPLGLLYLASVLEQHGFDVQYIDCLNARVEVNSDGRAKFVKQNLPTPTPLRGVPRIYGRYGITVDEFHHQLSALEPPEAILVSSGMTYWYPGLQETIRELRLFFPNVKIVLGGIYATLMPDHARHFSGADLVVSGPAENLIVNILTDGKHAFSRYQSIDHFPTPAWHLTDQSPYRILLTSRGCPYRCTFCASDVLNTQKFLQRNWENVLNEIENFYYDNCIREFVFYDDALLINHRKHLEPLLSEMIKRSIKAHFHTPNGLNAREIDEPLAGLMHGSGFRTIRLSLESVNPEIQKHQANNKINNHQFQRAVENLYRAGYRKGDLECYLIMGLPNQTSGDVRKSLSFVSELGVIARLATYSPIPGTMEAEATRRMIGDDFINEPLLQNHSCFPLRNLAMMEEELQFIKLECNFNNEMIRSRATHPSPLQN